ncbi:MAG TPA: hypothetical protein VK540_31575 [Polyangiaceae bacterium]|nr:hypothetical protein [Polyangiaceae bacterium]
MRVTSALDGLVSTLAVSLVAVALVLTLAKVWPGFPRQGVRDVVAGALLAIVAQTIRRSLRRLPKFAGALALDVYHGFSDRLTSALSFAGLPASQRTPLMDAAIDDACQRTDHLSPRKAAPFSWPRDLAAAIGLGAGVAFLALLQVRQTVPLSQVKTIQPVVLSADDIDLFREVGKKLAETDKTPEVLAALQAYNQLVEDLAQKRLDRTEAFRRMHEIEARLMEGRALDAKELEEQLKRRAAALKKSELSRPAAEALEKQDFAKAERELRELAKKLREKPDTLAKAQLERLRDAMKKAAEGQKERLAALEQRREELRQQLLMQKKEGDGGISEEERSLFQKKERELERLDRELESEQRASRKLDRLDRDLEKAAEDLMRELGLSADDLDQGAEDINRIAQEKMSDEEREELRQRLEDLREQLRQEGQGGAQRMARLRRFIRQARGEGQGKRQQSCPPDDPNCKQDEQQQDGEGDEGQQGQKGQGKGDDEGQTFTIGPGGQRILVMGRRPGQGQGQPGEGKGQGQGQGQEPGGSGQDKGGQSAGHGHDPNVAGRPTNPKMGTLDVQAAGIDTGQGASRSEVILGASDRGFKGGAYKKVYTEYRTSAEEQMHRDQIPPGANDHVRRYFDLIRPRE